MMDNEMNENAFQECVKHKIYATRFIYKHSRKVKDKLSAKDLNT